MANRLASSASPYLLQHADNPVDWWEWEPAAFEEARRRDVPVILSVGYAACHWCHVMAHESFEDPQVAAVMNGSFVSIKVDREERPDVDAVYMRVTQAMTGHGGWPMTVFLTPDAEPFFAGTYFPPQPRHGMASFVQVLEAVARSWRERRADLESAARSAVEQLTALPAPRGVAPGPAELASAVERLAAQEDRVNGGFGGAPKFPPAMTLQHLLRHHGRTGDAASLGMVRRTAEAMARGGMHDQLGGGFARYSVDETWTVPHFEKMLYDNALLLRTFTGWWVAEPTPTAERVVRGIVGFLLRELRTAEGGFASALDADSEGHEGRFYVWTPEQLVAALGAHDGAWAAELFDVTDAGTFEDGASVLQLRRDPDDPERFDRVREALLAARAERERPARDDKVVAAWNGMVIAALAEAGARFDEPEWIEAAAAAADLLISVHLGAGEHGDRLVRVSRDGAPGRHAGLLEDHACVADGLLALHQATGEDEWLAFAGVLLDVCLTDFVDDEGRLRDTATDAEPLVLPPDDPTDNATPSGTSAAAHALLTYAALTGSVAHREAAESALGVTARLATTAPRFAGWALAAAEALADGPLEVAVVAPSPEVGRDLVRAALSSGRPGLVVATGPEGSDHPLLRDRTLVEGGAAAYVCRRFVCDRPVTTPEALAELLGTEAPAVDATE